MGYCGFTEDRRGDDELDGSRLKGEDWNSGWSAESERKRKRDGQQFLRELVDYGRRN